MTETEIPPVVSIGMPVYNGEKTIREAIDSLLAQDFKSFELIISDNASTDSTGYICQQYAARDPRVRYHRNDINIGPIANFNRLIHSARGNYFMWAADDDFWFSSYISCMVEALNNNPDAVLSFCRVDYLCSELQYKDKYEKTIGYNRFYRLFFSCYLTPPDSRYIYGLIRREILLKCGGMETRVDVCAGADVVTLFHLSCYGTFVKVDKPLFRGGGCNPDRHIFKEPIMQRLKKYSLFPLVLSYLKWLGKYHQHYHILRIIIKETSLHALHKIILLMILYMAEFLFYIYNIISTLIFWNRKGVQYD